MTEPTTTSTDETPEQLANRIVHVDPAEEMAGGSPYAGPVARRYSIASVTRRAEQALRDSPDPPADVAAAGQKLADALDRLAAADRDHQRAQIQQKRETEARAAEARRLAEADEEGDLPGYSERWDDSLIQLDARVDVAIRKVDNAIRAYEATVTDNAAAWHQALAEKLPAAKERAADAFTRASAAFDAFGTLERAVGDLRALALTAMGADVDAPSHGYDLGSNVSRRQRHADAITAVRRGCDAVPNALNPEFWSYLTDPVEGITGDGHWPMWKLALPGTDSRRLPPLVIKALIDADEDHLPEPVRDLRRRIEQHQQQQAKQTTARRPVVTRGGST